MVAILADDQFRSWGRYHRYRHNIAVPASLEEAQAVVQSATPPILAVGKARSYGDTCLNEGGTLIDTRRLDRFVSFNRKTGELVCEPGVSLADILDLLERPLADGTRWFLPVTPGTKFVTVAGAIANDVHGKNHRRQGTFGRHVNWFDLVRSDGQVLRCSATRNEELFRATIGGLGLTGLIGTVSLNLMKVPSLALEVEDIRTRSLDEYFALARESAGEWDYNASWVDVLAKGSAMGRGIFTRARHAPAGHPLPAASGSRRSPSVPVDAPAWLLNSFTLKTFNAVYLRKGSGRRRVRRLAHYNEVFYPLDAIGTWNRLYGKPGFLQYQCVVPPAAAREAIAALLAEIAVAGQGSFLAVLKDFGPIESPGLLSFPAEGTTLALDFPNRGKRTLELLDRLDAILVQAGGRIYPAKDGRMSGTLFAGCFPNIERFKGSVDPSFSSSFWRRMAGA